MTVRIINDPLADAVKIPRCALLDAPTEPHPILDRLMAEAATRLYLISDGRTATLTERVSGSNGGGSNEPTGDTTCHEVVIRYTHSRTHRRRLGVILEAQEMYLQATHAPDRSMVRGTKEWRERIAADPRPLRVLERVYGVGKSTVGRIKKDSRQAIPA